MEALSDATIRHKSWYDGCWSPGHFKAVKELSMLTCRPTDIEGLFQGVGMGSFLFWRGLILQVLECARSHHSATCMPSIQASQPKKVRTILRVVCEKLSGSIQRSYEFRYCDPAAVYTIDTTLLAQHSLLSPPPPASRHSASMSLHAFPKG